MTFQLDTSGYVLMGDREMIGRTKRVHWSDLDPFTQGHVEAMFSETITRIQSGQIAPLEGVRRWPGFSDLAPETLARIIAECEARLRHKGRGEMPVTRNRVESGRAFWIKRQAGGRTKQGFPPLTVSLGDDGKVRFA